MPGITAVIQVWREGKKENKKALRSFFALPDDEDIPILAMVTRLTKQKGLELVTCVFHEIMTEPVQMIILGTGEPQFEHFFREMEHRYPDKFKAYIGFEENLAHQIYAGSDLFLMPSKFEPCGLGQMIAMRYGTVPIVRETGGLNDTVQSYNEFTGEGTVFLSPILMLTICCLRFAGPFLFIKTRQFGKY